MAYKSIKNEVSFYPEIRKYIEDQIQSNFCARGYDNLSVFWGGEGQAKLQDILPKDSTKYKNVKEFVDRVPPLNLDIFALITDGENYEILVLEVKLRNSVGLKEWSQLLGYCLVSGAKYGLLLNVDNGASDRLNQILSTEEHLSHVRTIVKGEEHEHCLGFMEWNSSTQSFDYSNLGFIKSMSDLCDHLISEFYN